MLSQIVLQIILILLNAVFTYAETAVISINDSKLEKLAASGDKKAVSLQRLTEYPSRFIEVMQTALTVSGFMGAAFAGVNFSGKLEKLLAETGIPENILSSVSVILITLAVSYLTLVFGRVVPERAAGRNPDKTALRFSGTASAVKNIFFPMLWLVKISSYGILKLIGVNPETGNDTVTEEEIIMMSDAGAENGTIDEDENRIIKNVFAFDDMTAGQICTHRTDVSVLWSGESIESWEKIIHSTRHSRFPVCGEHIDNIIGVLNAKDYFRLEDKSIEIIMKNAVHEPYFVHENMKADRLFAQMKKTGSDRFAVVVDEYGGMSGIITVTDLVEQLVGEFDDDELDEPDVNFEKTGENTWIIPGITSLSEVCRTLEINLPADKYDTFGGYVIAALGEIPKDGTQTAIDSDGLHIEIQKLFHHRIEICRVTKIIPDENQDDNE